MNSHNDVKKFMNACDQKERDFGKQSELYLDLIVDGLIDYDKFHIVEGEGFFNGKSVKVNRPNFLTLPKNPYQKMLFQM